MASLTIRKLDETVKAYLRLRSAGNGRSVEEEVRVILGELIQGRPDLPGSASSPPSTEAPEQASRSVSPYSERNRHPDHRRRHRRLQIAGTDPAAERATHSTSAAC